MNLERSHGGPLGIDRYRTRLGSFGNHSYPQPDNFQWLADGQVLTIGVNT
jgi:hypothetical protein